MLNKLLKAWGGLSRAPLPLRQATQAAAAVAMAETAAAVAPAVRRCEPPLSRWTTR